jgi:hypothetical protein
MLLVATCTPKQLSLLALYSRAFSTLSPLDSSKHHNEDNNTNNDLNLIDTHNWLDSWIGGLVT